MSSHTDPTPFLRVASCAPELRVGDVDFNAAAMDAAMDAAAHVGRRSFCFLNCR